MLDTYFLSVFRFNVIQEMPPIKITIFWQLDGVLNNNLLNIFVLVLLIQGISEPLCKFCFFLFNFNSLAFQQAIHLRWSLIGFVILIIVWYVPVLAAFAKNSSTHFHCYFSLFFVVQSSTNMFPFSLYVTSVKIKTTSFNPS